MTLTIVTNKPDGHEGTAERDNTEVFYDFAGKFRGCLDAAQQVSSLTVPVDDSLRPLRLRDANGDQLPFLPIIETTHQGAEAAVLAVHSSEHVRGLLAASEEVRARRASGDSTFFKQDFGLGADVSPGTYQAAMSAVAACLQAVDGAIAKRIDPTFALVWPPGHHAEGPGADGSKDLAMGYCYFSNAAIAAKYARDTAARVDPEHENRVLVIDIDNHSGNGTRKALADERNMLMVDFRYQSSYDVAAQRYTDFRWDPANQVITVAREYPFRFNDEHAFAIAHPIIEAPNLINLDFFSTPTTEERERNPETRQVGGLAAPEEVLQRFIAEALPKIREFKPDVIILSVGVDSAENDPIGGLGFSPGAFYSLTRGIRLAFPQAAIAGVLEGGYEPNNWYSCLQPIFVALHEDPTDNQARSRMFRHVAADFASDPEQRAYWEKQRS